MNNGQVPWEQLSFSADQSGKFKVNYLYDVMNEKDGGQLVRELIWARDTFGYEPKEGSPAKLWSASAPFWLYCCCSRFSYFLSLN